MNSRQDLITWLRAELCDLRAQRYIIERREERFEQLIEELGREAGGQALSGVLGKSEQLVNDTIDQRLDEEGGL